MTARGAEDLPPHLLRVASVRNGQSAVQGYTVSSTQDPDRWPGHLADLLTMVPGAAFDPASRTWTVGARQWRWLRAALGEHQVLALDPAAGDALGLPVHEPDTARSVPWPVGKDVLEVLGALTAGARITEGPAGPLLIARDDTRRPVPARTWDHLLRLEVIEQDPRQGTWRLTGDGARLVTDPKVLRRAHRRRVEPHRLSRAERAQITLGDRAVAASPPEHPEEGYAVARVRRGPPQDELLSRPLRSGDLLDLKLAGPGGAEWRRVQYRVDRPRDGRKRRQVAWLDLGAGVRFHLWRERMVLRWPEEALRTADEGAGDATPLQRPGPAGGVRGTR